jgi:protein involved in polysaccharide export with SLBB domain
MFPYRNVLWALLAIALAGCSAAGGAGSSALQSYASSQSDAGRQATAQSRRTSYGAYLLGPGDRLRVKSYGDEEVSGEYEINSAGFVSIPLIGEVRAAGVTTTKLEQAIASKMKGSIATHPKITVEIAAYAPFYVFGEVKKAGEYSFHPGLTVADALAMAGGLTYRANESRIYVRRAGSTIDEVVSADMSVPIYPGDNIRVSERIF